MSRQESAQRVVVAAVLGAFLGAACAVIAYALHPALTLDMDRSLPRRFASGLYDSERSDDTTFAWTSQRADIKLADLSRRTSWACSARLRGGRSDPATQPSVDILADGIVAATVKATNEFQDVTIALPPRPSRGAVVTVASSNTLVPGPSDPRQLGVQIDRVRCAPDGGVMIPPFSLVRDAALIGAVFGGALTLSGLTLGVAVTAVLLLAVLQALPLSAGPAPYIGFSQTMLWWAIWIGAATVACVAILDRLSGTALQTSARIVIVFSAAVMYLKLLALLHPSKLPIDAVFHAHRLEWVLAGKYFFTQPMPGGVTFPYAIGLYVFAAPWTVLTRDYVTLLRVIVCGAQAIAGALLYPVVIRAWSNRTAAVMAVILFNLVPLPYGLVGNANLTNTFGEAVALTTMLTASLLVGRSALSVAGLFLVCALAFLSHVSTFALLAVTLTALALLYRVMGQPALRPTAWSIFVVAILSAILAVVLYYGHFADVYKNALRVRASAPISATSDAVAAPQSAGTVESTSLISRIANALTFAVGMIGWPILVLAGIGGWRLAVEGARDRASLAVFAWASACAAFLGVAVMRVDAPFQRYSAEFFGRVLLATFPAAVVLAARGTAWAWNSGWLTRVGSALLILCAAALGFQSWAAWFH